MKLNINLKVTNKKLENQKNYFIFGNKILD
jgi:hypothetical protein